MIYAIIALIIAGVVVAVLSVIAAVAIQDSRRQARFYEEARRDLEAALAGKEALKAENTHLSEALEATRRIYNSLLAEHRELEARSTALQQALEARPTQAAKRVRKNGAQTTEKEA